jgi:hypothetical protein
MAKDFRTNVEFNNNALIIGNLTASAGTTTLGSTNASTLNLLSNTNAQLLSLQSSSVLTAGSTGRDLYNYTTGTLLKISSTTESNTEAGEIEFIKSPTSDAYLQVDELIGSIKFNSQYQSSLDTDDIGPSSYIKSTVKSSTPFGAPKAELEINSSSITIIGITNISTLKATTGSVGGFQILAGKNDSNFTSVGASCLSNYYVTPGSNHSIAIGHQSQQYVRAGFGGGNISMGSYNFVASAGNPLDNIVIGNYAFGGENIGVNNLTGNSNIIIGTSAFATASGTNSSNVAIGVYAMYSSTINAVVGNTSIGYSTLNSLSTGQRNTVVGANSGGFITNGSYNLILGSALNAPSGSVSGIVLIGNDSAGGKATATDSNQIILGTASHKTIIPGTASVGGNRVTTNDIIRGLNHVPTGAVETVSRIIVGLQGNSITVASSAAHYSFFTATETINASSVSIHTFNAVTLNPARFALYTVSNAELASASLTLVARSASTSVTTTTGGLTTRAFDTTGGYPATYTLTAGTRYAIGVYGVGATNAQYLALSGGTGVFNGVPIMSKYQASQSDLTLGISASSLSTYNGYFWARISGTLA